jgi:DNA-binding response OmpR family regulator
MEQKTILILEDDQDIRNIVSFILSHDGYQIEQCSSVREFNDIISQKTPDLFVLDIALPDGSGLDVCKQLKQDSKTSDIPVLLMSAHVHHLISEGYQDDFISKPFDIGNFKKKVKQYA